MTRYILVVALLLSLLLSASASAQTAADCSSMPSTIGALRECVQHALMMGHITNAGVAQSLLAKLDAAQAAVDRGQSLVAVQQLQAFVNEVQAQWGKFIVAEHAAHLLQHALAVIQNLQT